MTITIQQIIKLDMTNTKKHQKKIKYERWNGYHLYIIKDSESALDKLREILIKKGIR